MKRSSAAAFTLVELLVVIGVIAILISFLLPAMQRVRDSAYQTKCLSNQRQILLAATLYISDNRMYPNCDGSWLDRVKRYSNAPLGLGHFITGRYLTGGEETIAKVLFCPSAKPTWNLRAPPSVFKGLTTNLSVDSEHYTSYVGKFCTFISYNDSTSLIPGAATRANLYNNGRQSARRMSPILVADYWFSNDDSVSGEQGHRGKGVIAGFHDGSARWIPASDVRLFVGSTRMANRAPTSNFWRYARVAYGDGRNSTSP